MNIISRLIYYDNRRNFFYNEEGRWIFNEIKDQFSKMIELEKKLIDIFQVRFLIKVIFQMMMNSSLILKVSKEIFNFLISRKVLCLLINNS